MLQLSRRTVRHAWPPYVGALVALTGGVTLLCTAITMIAAVERALTGEVSAAEREQLDDLSALFGTMSAVAMFMAIFVVSSAFGFVVATRQRQLGLLRLVGATPRQVRRMVLGESALVALLAAVLGGLLSMVAGPAFLLVIRWRGITDLALDLPAPWLAWSIAAPSCLLIALAGSWRASKRAGKVSPVAAFGEAAVERRRPGFWQLVAGSLCFGSLALVLVLIDDITPLFTIVMAILLPEVVVVGLYCFGGLIFPALGSLLARPFVGRWVEARLARDHVRTAVRTPVALAAPILAISAIAGSMIVTLSLTADWTSALNREQLSTPVVVSTQGDREVARRLTDAHLPLVDPQVTVVAGIGGDHRQPVEAIEPATAIEARGLHAVDGDLDGLAAGGVAVTETWRSDAGTRVGDRLPMRIGDRTIRPEVVAVVRDAPDLYAEVVAPRSEVLPDGHRPVPETLFVDPGDADLDDLLSGTSAQVLPADRWIDRVDRETRTGNTLGLWVLLGPAGAYAAIAIVNAVLVGAGQRREQLRAIALLGGTPSQLRRMAVWEAGLIGGSALLLGGLVTGFVGWLVRFATSRDVDVEAMTVPWLPLGAIAAVCVGLAVVAALVGSRRVVH